MLKVKSIKPTFTKLIVTADRYAEDQMNGTLIDASKTAGRFKEYQKVVKVGSYVKEVKEGDIITIDVTRYIKRKFSEDSLRDDFGKNPIVEIDVPMVEMDGIDYFMIDERDILYIIDDYEEIPDTKSGIIKPREPKLTI